MDKRFWAIIGIIIVLFAGILFMNSNKSNTNTGSSNGAQPTNHVEGNASSKVRIVEYGDYQCPYCGEFFPITQQVEAKYASQVAFQFRNLPLNQIHQNAYAGARAAEAADLQGKFWQMHDLLYQNQNDWSESTDVQTIFDGYAQQLGLNLTKFKQDFASSTVNDRINADIAEFKKTGQQMATPTFFLNGKKIQPTSVDDFSKDIDAALKQVQ